MSEKHVCFCGPCSNSVAKLNAENATLREDLLFYDTSCRYCLMPEVEAAWRHDHNGDGRFHWHHRLDPGDGLISDCANSHLFEEVWALAAKEKR